MTLPKPPDVLVLGVGGVLGEAWMSGFLSGVTRRSGVDFREADFFVGTSAGAIVAARLAAGVPPQRPGEGTGPAIEAAAAPGVWARTMHGRRGLGTLPVAGAALRAAAPGGALARAALLSWLPAGRIPLDGLRSRVAALAPHFDGRLRVAAVDVRSGRRVVFGAAGAPEAQAAEAVAASCAIPGVFRPVRIGSRDYVDGGVWSPTNLDAAPVRAGARVLCLVPTAALTAGPMLALRTLARGWAMATAVEAAALRARGAQVTIVRPAPDVIAAMGPDLMDARRRERVTVAAFAQGLAAASGTI